MHLSLKGIQMGNHTIWSDTDQSTSVLVHSTKYYILRFRPNGEILSYTLYKQNDRVSHWIIIVTIVTPWRSWNPILKDDNCISVLCTHKFLSNYSDGDNDDNSWQRKAIYIQGADAQVRTKYKTTSNTLRYINQNMQ